MYCVYMHITPSNKKYVGMTGRNPEKRWGNGTTYTFNRYFDNAIKKYGWDNIEHVIIKNNLTYDEACSLEIKLIQDLDLTNPENGYNIAKGGNSAMLGRKHSEETKRKMSESASKRVYDDDYRKKISRKMKQKYKDSPEFRAQVAKAKEKACIADHSWSEEQREKFHKSRLGYKVSQETRAKLRAAHKGKSLSQETINKIIESHKKPVICLETGKIWDSVKAAAIELNIKSPWLGKICNDFKGTVSGLHFCFVSDLENNSLESREKMITKIESNRRRITKRQVKCVETGIIYESVTLAAKSVGISRKRIEKVCKTSGTAAGYHWEYV